MRKQLLLATGLLGFVLPISASVAEPLLQPHALLYYQFSFDGSASDARRGGFGLRMDHLAASPHTNVNLAGLLEQPAALLDIRVNSRGLQSLSLLGRDYLQGRRVHHAQNEATPEEAPASEPEAGERPGLGGVLADAGDIVAEEFANAPGPILLGLSFGLALLTDMGG